MKIHTLCLLLVPLLSSCSLIGAKVGKEVDKSRFGDAENTHKYEAQYMVEGLEEDVEIIKLIFSEPAKVQSYVDPDPCKGKNRIQVCTVKKGCWCENNIVSKECRLQKAQTGMEGNRQPMQNSVDKLRKWPCY